MKLSPAEQGQLNGMFEAHFGIELPKGTNISIEQCDKWEELLMAFMIEVEMQRIRKKTEPPKKD